MITKDHPRYNSLMLRNKIADGVSQGLVHPTGLIAQGRGEAFDYLIGEITQPFAVAAAQTAAAYLSYAKQPVLSINGNTAILVPDDITSLAREIGACIEVNLFHRSIERIERIISHLEAHGGKNILGLDANARIPGLSHDRALCSRNGIYAGDVILVPLEDGDRCEALKKMGKTVLTVDLNPLSRTSRTADVTIVDNITRAMPAVRKAYATLDKPREIITSWNNARNLQVALDTIAERLRIMYH